VPFCAATSSSSAGASVRSDTSESGVRAVTTHALGMVPPQ
jgi:hypothetical protein